MRIKPKYEKSQDFGNKVKIMRNKVKAYDSQDFKNKVSISRIKLKHVVESTHILGVVRLCS